LVGFPAQVAQSVTDDELACLRGKRGNDKSLWTFFSSSSFFPVSMSRLV
jgi:hypothetical protein